MRTIFILLCMFPVLCIGQSPSNSTAATQHQQALQQLQQHAPQAQIVDLDALAIQQAQAHHACGSCAKKAKANAAAPAYQQTSKQDLLAKQTQLLNTIQALQQATPIDQPLLQKYQQALKLNLAALQKAATMEAQQAELATKKAKN